MKDLEQITRDDIIESAIALFGQYGFQNVSMDRLAEYWGHSKSLLYKYFSSKNSIMLAAIRMIYRKMNIEIPTANTVKTRLQLESPRDILLSYCYSPDEQSQRYFTYYRLLYREVLHFKRIRAVLYRIWHNNYLVLSNILEHMAQHGAIPAQPDRTLAEMWARAVMGFTLWKTFDPYIYEIEYDEIVELFIRLATSGDNRLACDIHAVRAAGGVNARKVRDFRQEIVEAAFQLFSEYGYEKTTLKMLATRLGCHISKIYYYFLNKQDILLGVFDHIKANKQDCLDTGSFMNYIATGRDEDLVAVLQNSYVCRDADQLMQYRIWIDMIYQNRDIRYYCLGRLIEKRVAFKIALHELIAGREMTNHESMHLATIFTFCQSSINIQNALFHQDLSLSEPFRLNFARIPGSLILYGALPQEETAGASQEN